MTGQPPQRAVARAAEALDGGAAARLLASLRADGTEERHVG